MDCLALFLPPLSLVFTFGLSLMDSFMVVDDRPTGLSGFVLFVVVVVVL